MGSHTETVLLTVQIEVNILLLSFVFLVTKRKMITKCGGMESGHLRSLRPSLRGTDVCTHMHESPTAEHANGGEPVMVFSSPSISICHFVCCTIALTLFTPPLIQSSIHPPAAPSLLYCASARATTMHGHRPPPPHGQSSAQIAIT